MCILRGFDQKETLAKREKEGRKHAVRLFSRAFIHPATRTKRETQKKTRRRRKTKALLWGKEKGEGGGRAGPARVSRRRERHSLRVAAGRNPERCRLVLCAGSGEKERPKWRQTCLLSSDRRVQAATPRRRQHVWCERVPVLSSSRRSLLLARARAPARRCGCECWRRETEGE